MEDRTIAAPIISGALREIIRERFGINIDSYVFSPMVDYIFKLIFTADDSRSKIALLDLLNSLLELEGTNKIIDCTVINAEIPVVSKKHKKAVFDIRVKFSNEEQAVVEMQLQGGKSFKKRAQFIISKAYASQEIVGEDYKALKRCYLICIVNFSLLGSSAGLVANYRFRNKKGSDLTDDETIIFIQLPEADKILDKPVEAMTEQEKWALFFRYISDNSKRDKLEAIIERKEGIKMAANVLFEISQDEKTRIQYENELLAELDTNSWISDAWEDGLEVGTEKGIAIGTEKGIAIGKEEGIVIGKEEGIVIGKEEGVAIGFESALLIIDALKAQIPVDEIASKYNLPVEQVVRIQTTMGR
jgi:predicted transposase/invertase (TIGR01784 family)